MRVAFSQRKFENANCQWLPPRAPTHTRHNEIARNCCCFARPENGTAYIGTTPGGCMAFIFGRVRIDTSTLIAGDWRRGEIFWSITFVSVSVVCAVWIAFEFGVILSHRIACHIQCEYARDLPLHTNCSEMETRQKTILKIKRNVVEWVSDVCVWVCVLVTLPWNCVQFRM